MFDAIFTFWSIAIFATILVILTLVVISLLRFKETDESITYPPNEVFIYPLVNRPSNKTYKDSACFKAFDNDNDYPNW